MNAVESFRRVVSALDRLKIPYMTVGSFSSNVPTVEDVIVTKLRWSKPGRRQKDVQDVEDVLKVQAGKLDLPYIRQWTDQHGTRELFEKLLVEIQRLT